MPSAHWLRADTKVVLFRIAWSESAVAYTECLKKRLFLEICQKQNKICQTKSGETFTIVSVAYWDHDRAILTQVD